MIIKRYSLANIRYFYFFSKCHSKKIKTWQHGNNSMSPHCHVLKYLQNKILPSCFVFFCFYTYSVTKFFKSSALKFIT